MVCAFLFFDTDAIFPMTEKYKALAKESAEKEELRKAQKDAQTEIVEVAEESPKETTEEITEAADTADEDNG